MKKGKVSEVEIACIRGMLSEGYTMNEIGEQLDRSVASVTKAWNNVKQDQEKLTKDHDPSLFINKTAGGQEGVNIMTEAASVRADEQKSQAAADMPLKHRRFILQIRSNEK